MGQEIQQAHFGKQDFARFEKALAEEDALLRQWFEQGQLSNRQGIVGSELEAWLVDAEMAPLAENRAFLACMDDELASLELSKFNVELNSQPRALQGKALALMLSEMEQNLHTARACAANSGGALVLIGTLPTVSNHDLCLANMSQMVRYRALNEQVLRSRKGRPLILDIQGAEHLHCEHHDVMLESAATSFQLHLQLSAEEAPRYYNASIIASAAVVGLAANSPYLFGKDLWDESRIPVFERAVSVGGFEGAAFGPIQRVSFGQGYVKQSLYELFEENLQHYPIILPESLSEPQERLPHLRLHNGTIWRWNRPLVGFDEDGTPHLRLEHRVIPAGPSARDAVANAAFYYGLVRYLVEETDLGDSLDFSHARDNFYAAAKQGLRAHVQWLDGRRHGLQKLLNEKVLDMAEVGLRRWGVDEDDISENMALLRGRCESGQNGAAWQRAYVAAHGRDMAALTRAYLLRQQEGTAVHQWDL